MRSIELPRRDVERGLFKAGAMTVAGIDEVGRGAWAGPVSVGVAIVSPRSMRRLPRGVADSKLLKPKEREELFEPLSRAVDAWAVGHASPAECDELGMTAAQRVATERALRQLDITADSIIVDGRVNFTGEARSVPIVGADRRCVVVAAASVLAKVTRDRMMCELAPRYADYLFERNKGYPSPDHRDALARLGLTDIHRASWSFATAVSQEPSAGSLGDSRL